MRMGGEGEALPAASPRGTRGAWICRICAGARRSECPERAVERRSHSRAGKRWEGRAAGASVSRGETQHLGAEQLHGAPQAGPAPRSPPLGAGGPRRLPFPPPPPRLATRLCGRPAQRRPQAGTRPAGGGRAEGREWSRFPGGPAVQTRPCSRGLRGVVVLARAVRGGARLGDAAPGGGGGFQALRGAVALRLGRWEKRWCCRFRAGRGRSCALCCLRAALLPPGVSGPEVAPRWCVVCGQSVPLAS